MKLQDWLYREHDPLNPLEQSPTSHAGHMGLKNLDKGTRNHENDVRMFLIGAQN